MLNFIFILQEERVFIMWAEINFLEKRHITVTNNLQKIIPFVLEWFSTGSVDIKKPSSCSWGSIYQCLFSCSKITHQGFIDGKGHKWVTCSQGLSGFVTKLFYINKRDTENGNYIIFSAVLKEESQISIRIQWATWCTMCPAKQSPNGSYGHLV